MPVPLNRGYPVSWAARLRGLTPADDNLRPDGESSPSPAAEPDSGQTVVFICGLHRSGTTPLSRWLGEHPSISRLADTGAPEDEGQHLQTAVPTAKAHGGAGVFAFDPHAHLTEVSPLANASTRKHLWDAWSPYWDTTKPILLEKSPPNVVRTRFLQALFPDAAFVGVIRHPIAVAYATRRINKSLSIDRLFRHWLHATDQFLRDAQALNRVMLVRYEDLITRPGEQLSRIFDFLEVEPFEHDWAVQGTHNDRYFDRWNAGRRNVVKHARQRTLRRRFEKDFGEFGYRLAPTPGTGEPGSAAIRSLLPDTSPLPQPTSSTLSPS